MMKHAPIAFLTVLAGLALNGCGFHPVHGGDSTKPSFDKVSIATIPDREGQNLRNNLIDRFYQAGYPTDTTMTLTVTKIEEVRTELDLTKSSDATRAQLRLKTTMTLTDTSGTALLQRNLQTVTSFNILGSEFATRVTEQAARQSAINDLARQIELNLSLFMSQR